jgi:hypothetical protein
VKDLQLLKLAVLVEICAEEEIDADDYDGLEVCWAFTGAHLHFALLFTISTISSSTKEYELHVKHYA